MSARYVADEAPLYEIAILIKNMYLRKKESWEQARLMAYTTAQVNSTKRIKPTDILSFPWDKKAKKDTHISTEDIQRLRKKAEDYLNNKKI